MKGVILITISVAAIYITYRDIDFVNIMATSAIIAYTLYNIYGNFRKRETRKTLVRKMDNLWNWESK